MGGVATLKTPTPGTTVMRQYLSLPKRTVKGAIVGLLLLHALGFASLAQATDSAAAAAAVARLLALPMAGNENAAPPPDTTKRATVLTLRGENLDRVIRRALPQQPFKDEFVRKAFVMLNADILAKNPTRALAPGTTLNIPSPNDLMAMLSAHYPALSKASTVPDEEMGAVVPKRRWVQFP
jgi:hypothetical protein